MNEDEKKIREALAKRFVDGTFDAISVSDPIDGDLTVRFSVGIRHGGAFKVARMGANLFVLSLKETSIATVLFDGAKALGVTPPPMIDPSCDFVRCLACRVSSPYNGEAACVKCESTAIVSYDPQSGDQP